MIENIIYDNHEEEWDNCLNDEEANKKTLTWLRQEDTLDRWRHNRVYSLVEPIIKFKNTFKWLTVGDGRYGTIGATNPLLFEGLRKLHILFPITFDCQRL